VVPGAGSLTVSPNDPVAAGAWGQRSGGPANPQQLNRYSYVLNNPVNGIDPSGHINADGRDDKGMGGTTGTGGGPGGRGGVKGAGPEPIPPEPLPDLRGQTMEADGSIHPTGEGVGARTGAVRQNTIANPVARRVSLRESTKQAIRDNAPKTAEGDYIDPNTRQVIPRDGPFDYGHRRGYEWRNTQIRAREEGWSRRQVIEWENEPSHYQIEDPSSNRGHEYEEP
jgi:hypothetical protein